MIFTDSWFKNNILITADSDGIYISQTGWSGAIRLDIYKVE